MSKGRIFDISHYMIEDGPGIRTNVFVKGCPLRCKWCSNAYGLRPEPELAVARQKCTGCKKCAESCPQGAIAFSDVDGRTITDFQKCTSCFSCVAVCPTRARMRVGTVMSTDEVLREAERDQIFYRRSGGGVTFSGGEILMQPSFVMEALQKCQDAYLDTAIETSGYGKWEDLEQMIGLSDLVFIDCKMMDEARHRELTGVSNRRILRNIRKSADFCKAQKKRLVIRLPLIPGQNDSRENIMSTAAFVKSLAGNPELNVLPYHNYGINKYENIGLEYGLAELLPHTKEQLEEIREWLKSTGVPFSIGGYQIE